MSGRARVWRQDVWADLHDDACLFVWRFEVSFPNGAMRSGAAGTWRAAMDRVSAIHRAAIS